MIIPASLIGVLVSTFIGVGLLFFLYKNVMPIWLYPVTVLIRERRGNSFILKRDRAKRIKQKTGEESYKLWKAKKTIEPPKFEHYEITPNGKPVLELYLPTSDDYRPINFNELPKITVEDKAARFWFVQEHKKIREKYFKATWMERYAPYISMILLGTFGTIQLIIWAKSTGVMSEHLAQASQSFAAAAEGIKASLAQMANKPPI